MPLGTERRAVQRPFVKYATEAGWTYLSPDDALRCRNGGVTSPVLDAVVAAQLQRLNPGIIDEAEAVETIKRLIRVRPTVEGNLEAWEYLKGLKTVFVGKERRERNIRLLDEEHLENNVFHVSDEFTFSNGVPPDISTENDGPTPTNRCGTR